MNHLATRIAVWGALAIFCFAGLWNFLPHSRTVERTLGRFNGQSLLSAEFMIPTSEQVDFFITYQVLYPSASSPSNEFSVRWTLEDVSNHVDTLKWTNNIKEFHVGLNRYWLTGPTNVHLIRKIIHKQQAILFTAEVSHSALILPKECGIQWRVYE